MSALRMGFPRKTLHRLIPLAAIGVLLFFASYALELGMTLAGIPPASTLLDNFLLGILGAWLVAGYLRSREEQERIAAAKARLLLVGELSREIRGPLAAMTRSLLLDSREERLRSADEALERIDQVLNLSLPAIGASTASRALRLQ